MFDAAVLEQNKSLTDQVRQLQAKADRAFLCSCAIRKGAPVPEKRPTFTAYEAGTLQRTRRALAECRAKFPPLRLVEDVPGG